MYFDEPNEIEPGQVLKIFDQLETNKFISNWVGSLLSEVKTRDFLNEKVHYFIWENLTKSNCDLLDKKQAQNEYDAHLASKYVVYYRKPENNSDDLELVAFTTDMKPNNLNGMDICVTPPNFAWSMFFTHEEHDSWIGPYFIKNKNYEKLNAENLKTYNSLLNAREKGWV